MFTFPVLETHKLGRPYVRPKVSTFQGQFRETHPIPRVCRVNALLHATSSNAPALALNGVFFEPLQMSCSLKGQNITSSGFAPCRPTRPARVHKVCSGDQRAISHPSLLAPVLDVTCPSVWLFSGHRKKGRKEKYRKTKHQQSSLFSDGLQGPERALSLWGPCGEWRHPGQ